VKGILSHLLFLSAALYLQQQLYSNSLQFTIIVVALQAKSNQHSCFHSDLSPTQPCDFTSSTTTVVPWQLVHINLCIPWFVHSSFGQTMRLSSVQLLAELYC
jgi:hypothetical protein